MSRYSTPLTLTFGEVVTHNHFALDRGGKVFKQTAPVIKLPRDAAEDDYLGLLALLNSSVACFWFKQVCYLKGGTGLGRGITTEKWEFRMSLNGTNVEEFPLTFPLPIDFGRHLDSEVQKHAANLPDKVVTGTVPTRDDLDEAHAAAQSARLTMVAAQEELDWHCYGLYGLIGEAPKHPIRLPCARVNEPSKS